MLYTLDILVSLGSLRGQAAEFMGIESPLSVPMGRASFEYAVFVSRGTTNVRAKNAGQHNHVHMYMGNIEV